MDNKNSLFLKRAYNPVVQALSALLLFGGLTVLGALARHFDPEAVPANYPWIFGTAFLLLYAMFNSVFSLGAEDYMRYFRRSLLAYMGLAAASGLLAWLFSGLSISEAGSYRWIYVVLSFGYLVFLAIMGTIKRLVVFFDAEDQRVTGKDS